MSEIDEMAKCKKNKVSLEKDKISFFDYEIQLPKQLVIFEEQISNQKIDDWKKKKRILNQNEDACTLLVKNVKIGIGHSSSNADWDSFTLLIPGGDLVV